MRKLLLMSCVCIFTLPVMAQDNAITIIREDGSKEVIPLGGPQASPESVVKRKTPEVEVKTMPAPISPNAPVVERAAEPVSAAKTKAVAAPARKKVKTKRVAGEVVPKPMRKPHRRVLDAPSAAEPISKDKALYIALSEAPPSRDVQVHPIQDDQGLLYSVIFKIEDGGYEVLVDGYSGVIIQSGKIENGQAVVKPGHLPVR